MRKDGSEIPIEIGLNPLVIEDSRFVLASIIDITERLNADRLQRSLQAGMLRQSILDSLPFSVIATDTEGQTVAINPAAEQLLGHPPQRSEETQSEPQSLMRIPYAALCLKKKTNTIDNEL